MVIDDKIKNKLLSWNDQPMYEQFEKKCSTISKISGINIAPSVYKLQYDLSRSSLDSYHNLQTEAYECVSKESPKLEFGMNGRLKSEFSFYEKVIRKSIEAIEKDDFKKPIEIYDAYAIKLFLYSINYNIDKVYVAGENIYIESGPNEFRPENNDSFSIQYNDSIVHAKVIIEKNKETGEILKSNIFIENGIPYIKVNENNEELILPIRSATNYKRSNKNDLLPYIYNAQKDLERFYTSNGFEVKKISDYILNRKPSGYEAIQFSLYSDELELGIECQIKTSDMDRDSTEERNIYKPNEKKISSNSLNRLPRFALTTRFPDGIHTYTMTDAECFEYIYGMSLQEYRKKMMEEEFSKKVPDVVDKGDDTSR